MSYKKVMKAILVVAISYVVIHNIALASTAMESWEALGTPATTSDGIFCFDQSATGARGTKLLFDSVATNCLNGDGQWSAFQPKDTDLDYLAGFTPTANVKSVLNAADYAAIKTLMNLTIGADVQAYDVDLSTYAGITPSANMQTFLGNSTFADMLQDLNRATAINMSSGDTSPDVTNGTTTLQPLWTTVGTATITDFDDGDDHSEFATGDKFIMQARTAVTLDCSENINLECNGGQDFTGSATQLVDILWRFDGTRWVAQNMIVPMSNPTTLAITRLTGIPFTSFEVDGHADANLTADNVSGSVVYNTGQAAADVALTLPTAASGYSALFTVATAQANKWGVRAGTNDKIYLLAADGTISAGADNGYARMTAAQVGQSFACWTFKTDAYDWMCKAVSIGTSTFVAN